MARRLPEEPAARVVLLAVILLLVLQSFSLVRAVLAAVEPVEALTAGRPAAQVQAAYPLD